MAANADEDDDGDGAGLILNYCLLVLEALIQSEATRFIHIVSRPQNHAPVLST